MAEIAEDQDPQQKFRLAPPGWRWRPVHFLPFVLDLISSLMLVYLPVLVGRIIDLHLAGDTERAWQLMWWMVAIILYFAFNERAAWGITFRVVARLERDWKLYIGQLMRQSTQRDTGALIAILNKDSRSLSMLWHPMLLASSSLGVTVFGTYQLWRISPAVALVSLVGLILTLGILTWISKVLEKHSDAFRETVGKSTSKASDIASSIRTILGLGAQNRMMGRYRNTAQEVYTAQLKLESVQTWSFAARNFLVGTVTMLAIAFALRGVLQDGVWMTDIPAGQLVTIVGLVNTLTGPIWSVEMLLFSWRNARVALKRVHRLEADVKSAAQDDANEVHARSEGAYIDIPKTDTVVHYINPRDHQLTAQDYAEALTASLRKREAHMSNTTPRRVLLSEPNPMIFAGTLRDHLQLGTAGLDDELMVELLKITDSEEIAFRLGGREPQAYLQAEISSEGTNLSGGQRQRLALARALAQQAEILVLIEPLNSVDEPSQKFILDRLETRAGRGALSQFQQIYIVSTTMEAERRIAAGHRQPAYVRVQEVQEAITASIQKVEFIQVKDPQSVGLTVQAKDGDYRGSTPTGNPHR